MRLCIAVFFSVVLAGQNDLAATKAEARKLFLAGSVEASAERWQQALATNPNDLETRLNYGIVLDALGRYAEANQQLTAAARIRATVPVLNNLAINLVHLKRRAEARRTLEQILQLDPRNTSALFNLGQLEMSAGRWEAAVRVLQIAQTLPGSDAGTLKSAQAAGRGTKQDEAAVLSEPKIPIWGDSADLAAPGESVVRELLRSLAAAQRGWADQLLRENRIAESIPHYQASLELNPDEPGVYLGAAIAMLRGNDAASALAVLEEAGRRFPSEVRIPIATGYVYESQSEWEEAETLYRKALLLEPKSVFAKISLGRTLRLAGKSESAVALLRTVAEDNPNSAPACYELANAILSADPANTEGMNWMRSAAELAPKSAEPRYAVAKAAMSQGNLTEAERWAVLAVKSDPGSAPAYYLLATIYRRRGKPDAAALELSKYEQLRKEERSSQNRELEQLLQDARASR